MSVYLSVSKTIKPCPKCGEAYKRSYCKLQVRCIEDDYEQVCHIECACGAKTACHEENEIDQEGLEKLWNEGKLETPEEAENAQC